MINSSAFPYNGVIVNGKCVTCLNSFVFVRLVLQLILYRIDVIEPNITTETNITNEFIKMNDF